MKQKSKLWLSLTVGASVFLSSQVAWADTSGPGGVTAEAGGAKQIGKIIDLEPGDMKVKEVDASAKLGVGKSTSYDTVVSGEIKLRGRRHFIDKDGPRILGGVIDPAISVKVDIAKNHGPNDKWSLQKLDVDAPVFKPFVASTTNQIDTPSTVKGGAAEANPMFILPNVSGVATINKFSDTTSYGGELSLFDPSLKGVFKANGLPIEVCFEGRPGLVLGQTKVGQAKNATVAAARVDLKGCAALDFGAIGKLGYDVNYRLIYNYDLSHEVTQSVSLRNIAKTPLFIQYTNTTDQSYSQDEAGKSHAKGAVTNMGYVGVAAF